MRPTSFSGVDGRRLDVRTPAVGNDKGPEGACKLLHWVVKGREGNVYRGFIDCDRERPSVFYIFPKISCYIRSKSEPFGGPNDTFPALWQEEGIAPLPAGIRQWPSKAVLLIGSDANKYY